MSLSPGNIPDKMRKLIRQEDREPWGRALMTSPEAEASFDAENERQLHKDILNYLRVKGVRWVNHARMDRKTTTANGTPDFQFTYYGRSIAMEAKCGKNQPTEAQNEALRGIIADGGIAAVVRSLDDVVNVMRPIAQAFEAKSNEIPDAYKIPEGCAKCGGAGKFEDGDRCGHCGGTGRAR